MSWNFHEDDLRRELGQLKERLSVQDLKIGQLQDQLVKNNEELSTARNYLQETSDKLRRETEQSLQLESTLKKKSEDLRNEKLTRENVENELRAAREDVRMQATSVRETEHLFNRLAQDANGTQQQQTKLLADKAKLEAQVRELQGELQRQQFAPPPPPKTPKRPRASSLTDLKMTSLEQDLERVRASASTAELNLEATKDKLSRAQSELLRVENEKAAVEKRMFDKDQKLQDILEDKSDLEGELEYYRAQNGSGEREEQLLARLEEEEGKVALLEQQLAKLSQVKDLERNLTRLRDQLEDEQERREEAETREIDLVAGREEALNELENARFSLEELTQAVQNKDDRINELERQKQALKEQLEESDNQTISGTGVTEEKLQEMLDAIARLRAERDQLKSEFEFFQLESKFTIQSLEAQITRNPPSVAVSFGDAESENQPQKSQLATSAMAVTVQHLHARNEHIDNASVQSTFELTTVDEEFTQVRRRLTGVNFALQEERERRHELELEVKRLEAERQDIKDELTDVLERYDRFQTTQTLPTEDATVALTEEIKMLEGRVVRRTEQIGVHQHDIKRLETNIRLLEERLEEATAELDMAETEKAAMLEDCSTAREERDAAKRVQEHLEIEVERVMSLLKEMEQQQAGLHAQLVDAEVRADNTTNDALAESNKHIESLEEDLRVTETALQSVRSDLSKAQGELEQAQVLSIQTMAELKDQAEADKVALSDKLSDRAHELEQVKATLEVLKAEHSENALLLRAKEEELVLFTSDNMLPISRRQSQQDRQSLCATDDKILPASVEVERFKSELSSAREECQQLASALQEKELINKENTEELSRLSAEIEVAESKLREVTLQIQRKEEELQQVRRELEDRDGVDDDAKQVLKEKDDRLAQLDRQICSLEEEKKDLLERIAARDSEAEKVLEESTSLRSALDQERECHQQELKKLEGDIMSLRAENEKYIQGSAERDEEIEARHAEVIVLLEATRKDLEEQRERYDVLDLELQNATSSRDQEINKLKEQAIHLKTDLEGMEYSLQQEINGRKQDTELHEEKLNDADDKYETLEAELHKCLEQYKEQLVEVRSSLMASEDERTALDSALGNLNGECHRANLKSQHLEKQLSGKETEVVDLRDELASVRQTLAQAQKSGRTAEMNLLLIGQQHERTISSLRNQLKEHEKDAERIQKLQQIVGEMKEQISEMETLLRAKTTEIEENDDKFIQLLKEKKKLTGKVESLTKKNNNLQTKLAAVSTTAMKPPTNRTPKEKAARDFGTPTEMESSKPPPLVPRASSSRESATQLAMAIPAKSVEWSSDVVTRRLPEVALAMNEISTTTYIGKKRRLPDDIDAARAPVEARLADTNRPESTTPPTASLSSMPTIPSETVVAPMPDFASTPRLRRPLQPLRTGFTPVRGQGLRPTLSQPSPIRKSVAAAMQDVTNSPPKAKRQFIEDSGSSASRTQKPASRGWLKKIRGDGAAQLQRSRHQSSTEDLQ